MTEPGPLELEMAFTFPNAEAARRVFESLRVDDDNFVKTSLDGATIRARARAPDAPALKRAADDLLACVTAAEGAASTAPDPDDEGRED